MTSTDEGYSYTPGALDHLAQRLRSGAHALDGAADRAVEVVDAGASTGAVGRALSGLLRMATATAGALDGSADRVHAATGAYDQTENTHAARLRSGAPRKAGTSRAQDDSHD